MKQILTLILFSFIGTAVFSQDLTGVWRGSFYNIREVMMGGARYRYEVQINNQGKSIKGVTYSYQTTRFYGKASLIGMWTPDTKNLVMKEEKMEDLKIEGGGEGCLMTCYLDYRTEGDKEYLEGTYTSRNMNTGVDCGGGKVFLERVLDSDFEKEDFLKKDNDRKAETKTKLKPGQEDFLVTKPAAKPKTATTPAKKPVAKAPVKKPTSPSTAKATPKKATPPVVKTTPAVKKPVTGTGKTATKPSIATKVDSTKAAKDITIIAKTPAPNNSVKEPVTIKTAPSATIKLPAPPILKQRRNELFQTITTSAKEITISFYDNGEIDGDTISVYDNNRMLVKARGLSAKPISVTVQLGENDVEHEIVMVAENLGSIPPNTALMIVQAGSQRYNVRLSSNEQKNAMVKFRYDPSAAE
ncbi:hypothetical protein BH10BAC3_BH10BAC3_37170 [soil metagenome]